MHDLIIYGAGGFGREAALLIKQINQIEARWRLVGFCDDQKRKGEVVDGFPVIGGLHELNDCDESVAVVLAVADPAIRKKIRYSIKNNHIFFPIIIHPSVLTGDAERNCIGEGTIICAGSILTTSIRIGSFCIVNLMCSIGHDVVLGDFCSIMPGCSISGFDTFKNEVYVGSGARILPQVTLGEKSRVGAGAVVTTDVISNTTVVGIPAKALSRTSV